MVWSKRNEFNDICEWLVKVEVLNLSIEVRVEMKLDFFLSFKKLILSCAILKF